MSRPKVDPAQIAEVLKSEFDAYVQAVMTAVNDAPDAEAVAEISPTPRRSQR